QALRLGRAAEAVAAARAEGPPARDLDPGGRALEVRCDWRLVATRVGDTPAHDNAGAEQRETDEEHRNRRVARERQRAAVVRGHLTLLLRAGIARGVDVVGVGALGRVGLRGGEDRLRVRGLGRVLRVTGATAAGDTRNRQ